MIYRCNFTQLSLRFIQLDTVQCGLVYLRVHVLMHLSLSVQMHVGVLYICVRLSVCVNRPGQLELYCDMSK